MAVGNEYEMWGRGREKMWVGEGGEVNHTNVFVLLICAVVAGQMDVFDDYNTRCIKKRDCTVYILVVSDLMFIMNKCKSHIIFALQCLCPKVTYNVNKSD